MSVDSDYRPESLLCVVAHPDDIEVCAGGTIARWVAAGTVVHYVICTDGAKGGTDVDDLELVKTRRREQLAAQKELGAHCVHQLEYTDGEVEYCKDLVSEIAKHIRAHKPDAVFTMDPTFFYSTDLKYPNHRDHRVIGRAVFDAFYPTARDASANNECLTSEYEPHAAPTLLMTNFNSSNFFVDITLTFDKKMNALLKHESQFGDGEGIREHMRMFAEYEGKKADMELAEGFVKLDLGF